MDGKRIFSKIGLLRAVHQIPMSDIPKAAVIIISISLSLPGWLFGWNSEKTWDLRVLHRWSTGDIWECWGWVLGTRHQRKGHHTIHLTRRSEYPKTYKELRRFLGTFNFYRRFTSNETNLQAALNDLFRHQSNKDNDEINWNSSTIRAFDKCPGSIANATLFVYFVSSKPLALMTDASSAKA